jgi:hypothetical protein
MDLPDRRIAAAALSVALALAGRYAPHAYADPPAPPSEPLCVVSRAEVLAAMRECGGYSLTATSNNARLQAEVVLRLIREAERTDPERRPLLIGHREWYEAFLRRTGLSKEGAPLAVRISNDLEQDLLVDYRAERVVGAVLQGPQPLTVANVWIYWPEGPSKPDRHSYDDTHSNPTLRVTQERLISYRLVDYGDRLWYADIHGLHGRPTSGSLGALFALIGEAMVVESRSATAPDGALVVRSHARKWGFDRTETMTVSRNGHVHHGIPPGRQDLTALGARLEEPLAIRFLPLGPKPAQGRHERDPRPVSAAPFGRSFSMARP